MSRDETYLGGKRDDRGTHAARPDRTGAYVPEVGRRRGERIPGWRVGLAALGAVSLFSGDRSRDDDSSVGKGRERGHAREEVVSVVVVPVLPPAISGFLRSVLFRLPFVLRSIKND